MNRRILSRCLGRIAVAATLVLCVGVALVGCSRKNATSILEPGDATTGARMLAGASGLDGPGHLEGVLGPGALWSIDVPADWNGDLVVYAHGYTPEAAPVALPNFGPLRDAMLAQRYAVAASSFSDNGYAVMEGMTQTHQLRALFVSKVGRPHRTYLVGVSLGGLISALLSERYPEQYDGSILVSGVLGGSKKQLTYVADVRVLFDVFYPGVLPGDLYHIPDGTNVPAVLGAAQAAIVADPQRAGMIAMLARVKPEYASGAELVESILSAIGFQLVGANDIIGRTHFHSFFDNADYTYAAPLPQPVLDMVNAQVARFRVTPDAAQYLMRYGNPTGDVHVPVIALHNSRDPQVPFAHEGDYLGDVTARAHNSNLLQRTLSAPYGHVKIQPAELTANLADLNQWVETGIKP